MKTPATPSQTVGPFFSIGLSHLDRALCTGETPGEPIEISGQVLDGAGVPVPDAVLECWQADSQGRLQGLDPAEQGTASPGFAGFVRVATDGQGGFRFATIRPGIVPTLDGKPQAPHIVVVLFMRGLLKHLYTRIYFAGDARNPADPVLGAIPPERRSTLYASPVPGSPDQYLWNLRLQGEDETVFFSY